MRRYGWLYWIEFCLLVCSGPTAQTQDRPEICRCQKQVNNKLDIVCSPSNYTKELFNLSLPSNTTTLDLSSCGLTRIPLELFTNLKNLVKLSLAENNIVTIEENAFRDLIGLEILNLTNNNITSWKGQIYPELPSLKTIDLTGNIHWKPDKRLLNVTSLREARGVSWSKDCANCVLQRENESLLADIVSQFESYSCNQPGLYDLQKFSLKEYTDTCSMQMCEALCGPSTKVVHKRIRQESNDKGKYFYAGYAVGSLAILFNLIVLVNVLLSKVMRRELSMYLIANMASCDILIGIYVILISKDNFFFSSKGEKNEIQDAKVQTCPISTILLTVGEIVSLTTALLLTIEKYTCIVYCMKPDIRLKKKHAFVFLLVAWICSFLFAMTPYFDIFNLKYSPAFMCIMPVTPGKQPTFIIYPLAVIAVNYILMLPMYLHIFLFVRRSSTAMGLHRNAALAKQVFIIVGSNFLFFVVPMILLVVHVFVGTHLEKEVDGSLTDHIVYVWLPIMLLGINSVLNPFLYAFRRKKFQREIIDRLCFGGQLQERLRRAFSALKSSRMSPSATKVEFYDIEVQSSTQRTEQQRITKSNAQIPVLETERVVLCKVTVTQ